MPEKPILIWINCYGPWAPDLRTPIQTIGYDAYLNQVADAIAIFKNRVTDIYLSGGMYDAHDLTECETTLPELKKRLAARGVSRCTFHADEGSVTSITIMRTFLQTWHKSYHYHTPLLFVDEVRYPTNKYALEYFIEKHSFNVPPVKEILIPIKRIDDHPDSTPEYQAEKLAKMKTLGVEVVEQQKIEARREHLTLR